LTPAKPPAPSVVPTPGAAGGDDEDREVTMWKTAQRSVRQVTEWHVRSQHVARRNALVASTALAARRREHDEAEEFLRSHLERRAFSEAVRPA
jgi:hypothetical protein